MNTAMTQAELERILDQAVQDVTERTAGVRLHQEDMPPGEDLCTVHITFDQGFRTSLTLCADTSLLARMACNSFHEESVSAEDLEEPGDGVLAAAAVGRDLVLRARQGVLHLDADQPGIVHYHNSLAHLLYSFLCQVSSPSSWERGTSVTAAPAHMPKSAATFFSISRMGSW